MLWAEALNELCFFSVPKKAFSSIRKKAFPNLFTFPPLYIPLSHGRFGSYEPRTKMRPIVCFFKSHS